MNQGLDIIHVLLEEQNDRQVMEESKYNMGKHPPHPTPPAGQSLPLPSGDKNPSPPHTKHSLRDLSTCSTVNTTPPMFTQMGLQRLESI